MRTVYIRRGLRGWEWSLEGRPASWWGFYRTPGLARGAAKRAVGREITFIEEETK